MIGGLNMDFTLSAYEEILSGVQAGGYRTSTIGQWLYGDQNTPVVLFRHDVDRRPQNALSMAKIEATRGIMATYYFRILPVAFNPEIIREISKLGHEIGYHYEDFYLAGYDPSAAIKLFAQHLRQLRELAPVRTIAMHGSPLARESNMRIWDFHNFRDWDVMDCILSHDYSNFVFFTDTGRSFSQNSINLRDYIGGRVAHSVSNSTELRSYLTKRTHDLVQINVHPERWNVAGASWARQFMWDFSANTAKRVIKLTQHGKR